MTRIYADENFDLDVVKQLGPFGYDVLTVQEAGKGGIGIPDRDVMAYVIQLQRCVLTFDRKDYRRLHRRMRPHFGIIACTVDPDKIALAHRIHLEISPLSILDNLLIRVVRPHIP